MQTKICITCGEEKSITKFQFRNDSNQYRNKCKECQASWIKKYQDDNKNKLKEQQHLYYLANYPKNKNKYKNYAQQNKETISKRNKKWREEHKQELKQKAKNYYFNNKEAILKRQNNNRNNINKYVQTRKIADINYKISEILRSRTYSALKGRNKSASTLKLLGCSVEFLKKYLESQFKDGMSWLNHSHFGWHIDHIKPICSFDLTDPKQQEECFNYKNLRPLWFTDNLSRPKPKRIITKEN